MKLLINSYCSLVGVSGLSRDISYPQNSGKFSQCTFSEGRITPYVEEFLARENSLPYLWASEINQKNFNVFPDFTKRENNLISKLYKGSKESINERNLGGFLSNCGVFA